MAGRLQDKVAVVTGGANGIGRACCVRFAEEGADVVVADLDAAQGEETVRLVRAAGRDARFVRTDTTSEADCLAMVQVAADAFGGVDVCLAAAGIGFGGYVSGQTWRREGSPADWHITRQTLDSWQTVLDVNLTGVMLTDRAVAQRMIDQGRGGSIINIASIYAKRAPAASSAYAVSKAGVWMLTKVAALELVQDRIRVNAIGPWVRRDEHDAPRAGGRGGEPHPACRRADGSPGPAARDRGCGALPRLRRVVLLHRGDPAPGRGLLHGVAATRVGGG